MAAPVLQAVAMLAACHGQTSVMLMVGQAADVKVLTSVKQKVTREEGCPGISA